MGERFVVIMAGGSGSRFWPASRKAQPKQFLTIGGDRSLLRRTADRVRGQVDDSRILVVTAKVHADHARLELPELPDENILVEPEGRNTAACIGWATETILARDPEALIAVLPADHVVPDGDAFCEHLDAAFQAASDRIVLMGLVPTGPETGYGYIEMGAPVSDAPRLAPHAVARFVEKPDHETALEYLQSGTYLWNSGIFVFAAAAMKRAIEKHLPELHGGLVALMAAPKKLADLYPELPAISVDYGVMEKAEDIAVIPSTFAWSDVGSWDAACALQEPDEANNVVLGDAMTHEARGTFVDSRAGRLVAAVGVEDLIIVDTTDAVLVVRRGQSQSVKQVVERLSEAGRTELL